MQGFHPQKHKAAKPKNYANGGIVTGPGTGTSDDVPAMVPADGYIMPADSTQALGFKPGMRAAQLSAGEAVLNPQQVQAAGGFQALEAMKNATHTPVQEQAAEGPKFFFADGGMTDDERRKAIAQIPSSAPAGWTGGQGERVTGNDFTRNVSNTMNALAPVSGAAAPIVSGMARGFGAGARAAAASPLLDKVASYGVPAAGFGALAMAANDKPTAEQAPGMTPPATQAAPAVRPAASPYASGQPEQPGTPAAQANAQAAGNVNVRRQPNGVMEFSGENISGDVSYGGPAGFKPRGAVSAQNMAAADNLAQRSAARGFTPRSQETQPQGPQVAVMPNTGGYGLMDATRLRERELRMATTSTRSNLESSAGYKARMAGAAEALSKFQEEQTEGPRNAAERELKAQELAMRGQEMQDARGFRSGQLANDSARLGLEGQRVGSEVQARGFEISQAKRLENLRAKYDAATDPKAKAELAQQLNTLTGKSASSLKDNFMVVGGGQEFDAAAGVMRNVPQQLIDLRTNQPVQGGQQGQTQPATTSNGKPVVKTQADLAKLPSGAQFLDEDGNLRVKR